MIDQSNNPIEDKIRSAARSLEPRREFSEALWHQIEAKPRRSAWYAPFQQIFARPVLNAAMALAIVAVAVFAIGPQNVATAFNNLIAYLPGVGFVQNDDGTLYLQQPVSIEQNGVTLTVDQAVTGETGTVISYHIDGLPEVKPGEAVACVYDGNLLRTANGRTQHPTGGGVESGRDGSDSSSARIEFPALPEGDRKATLLVSMNIQDPACTAPAEWSVDLEFGAKPAGTPLMPVIEGKDAQLPAVTDASASPNPADSSAAAAPQDNAGIRFNIDQIAALNDGYLITGQAQWDNKAWRNVQMNLDNFQVIDADGNPVPAKPADDGWEDNRFAIKITGKEFKSPLTLKIPAVTIMATEDEATSFSFDAGANPQIGQSWDLNQDLTLAGQKIQVKSIRAIHQEAEVEGQQTGDGFEAEIKNTPEINNVGLWCQGKEEASMGWSEGKNLGDTGKILSVLYPDGLPTGKITCHFQNLMYQINGAWQVQWQLP
jgi:hypothetical protein